MTVVFAQLTMLQARLISAVGEHCPMFPTSAFAAIIHAFYHSCDCTVLQASYALLACISLILDVSLGYDVCADPRE